MRRNNKKIITMMVMLTISMTAVTGCKKDSEDVDNGNQIEVTVDNSVDNTKNVTQPGSKEEASDSITDSNENVTSNTEGEEVDSAENDATDKNDTEASTDVMVEIPIYTMNDETLETEDTIALVPADEELTAETIVNAVVSVFGDNNYDVGVQSVSQEDDTVIVNLLRDSAPVSGVGASVETTTLDCISHSLIDNLPTCNKVIFRIEGEAYSTGHNELGINEPYCIR